MRESVAGAPEANTKKPTKNAEPTNPKAHRFSSRNVLDRLREMQAPSERKFAKSEKLDLASARERPAKRHLVGVLEVTADR